MAIFDKIGDAVGGAFEGLAGKAMETMTGGFKLGDIASALSGAVRGDFSGLMELGANALATTFLGPAFGPMAADIATGLMRGEGLNTDVLGSALADSGILPGTETFDAAVNVFGGIAQGDFDMQQATEMLAGLGVSSEQALGLLNAIGSGQIDISSLILGSGVFTGGFAGGPGAGGILTRS